MNLARALVQTVRPHQWVKNLFVAAPLVFAKQLGDPASIGAAAGAVASFCLISGAVYTLNDLLDADKDRAHPIKQHRPIASGALSTRGALLYALALATIGLTLAGALALPFLAVAAGYLVLNIAYSLKLKRIAFVDVTVIALGFLLRVLGGAFAIHVEASPWLLACTGLLAAFLGFGKRAHELAQATLAQVNGSGSPVGTTRAVLLQYRAQHLNVALVTLAVLTSVAYVLYTLDDHTVRFFGSRAMVWTAPFCVLGIARFLRLLYRRPHGDSPTEEILHDLPFMANLAVWGAFVVAIIYRRGL